MLKYVETAICFAEVPDEISLCINISNCPHRCVGCHSPHLQEDAGEELTFEVLDKLINKNKGITCVCFMGDGGSPEEINNLASYIVLKHERIKVGWYTGRETLPDCIDTDWFDYIKVGPYIEELGGLDKETTNQRMYHYTGTEIEDITWRFWK